MKNKIAITRASLSPKQFIENKKPEEMKVYIWDKELCNGAEWNDFLKCVDEKTQENENLKQQIRSLEEQLKNVIVPKFKPKDIVYVRDGEEMVECFIDKVIVLYDGSFLYEAYNFKGAAFSKLYKSNGFNINTEAEGKRLAELKGETK